MSAEAWWRWLTDQLGTTVQVDIARLTQVEQSATSRWKSGHNRPRPEVVIAVCRTIGRPPVEGLIAAGYLQAGESAQVVQLMPDLDAIPDAELIGQLARRLEERREESQQSQRGPAGGGAGGGRPPITTGHPDQDALLRRAAGLPDTDARNG